MRKLLTILLFLLPLLGFIHVHCQQESLLAYVQQQDTIATQPDSVKTQTPVVESSVLRGKVDVTFRIDAKGEVEIIHIFSDNPELINYVITRLKKIKLDPAVHKTGQVIKYSFDFNRES